MDNDPNKWNVLDPYPDKDIDDILPISQRAFTYFARNRASITDYYVELNGAITMLKGLDYHHQNTVEYANKMISVDDLLTLIEEDDQSRIINVLSGRSNATAFSHHEIAAYLNRLYQFEVFYRSRLTHRFIKQKKIRAINAGLKFRHNLTGKRKIDYALLDEKEKVQAMYSEIRGLSNASGHVILQLTLNC